MKKFVIWSNRDLKLEDWEDEFEELRTCFDEEISENEKWDMVYQWNAEYLDDERINLNISVPNGIICIADPGLWNGRRSGYKKNFLYNIKDCLSGTCGDFITWYVDELGDLRCEDCHHDGTNYYTYRAWKDDVSEARKENFMAKIYSGTATRKDMNRVTRKLGGKIGEVYGWKI